MKRKPNIARHHGQPPSPENQRASRSGRLAAAGVAILVLSGCSGTMQALDDANRAVSKAESVRAFRILPEDFTIEGGELTPTLKVKRQVVADRYAEFIDDIYAK